MNRTEHMQWCKQRALQYCDNGNPQEALTSMLSDLGKHEETKNHAGIQLGMMMKFIGLLETTHQVREFIEGFN